MIDRIILAAGLVLLSASTGLMTPVLAAPLGRVAYLQYTAGYWQVWLMNADGSEQRTLTSAPYDKASVAWYPDGRYLLVNGVQGELAKVDSHTGATTQLPNPARLLIADASVTSDGKRILFSLRPGAANQSSYHLWLANEDGSGLQKLTDLAYLQHQPVWAPHSDWIYFVSGKGDQSHDIWRMNYRTREVEQLTNDRLYHFDIAVSVRGELAYSNNRTGNYELWRWDGKGQPHQLTDSAGLDAKPTWCSAPRSCHTMSRIICHTNRQEFGAISSLPS
jgi:Tol biopolymer transport system component